MALSAEKLVEVLEERYGVRSEFTDALRPLLARFASEERSPEEWDALLGGLAEAHRACHGAAEGGDQEVRVLIHEVGIEMRKIDESVKVLSAYLDRLRARVSPPAERLLQ